MAKIYALLVGINDYPPKVGRLFGCLNDIGNVREYLTTSFGPSEVEVQTLENGAATHAAIVGMFDDFLGRAGAGDVALFHYSGHGARWASASAFREYYPDGRDEGLVCFDSRDDGKYDLADKELAVLLSRVAAREPHLALVLDCCHSGSATRSVNDFGGFRARQTHEVTVERPLESYLDEHYQQMFDRGERLHIPTSRHIALAACERVQKAWEGPDRCGVFTSSLLEVLLARGGAVRYSELFQRCRAAVRSRADNQDPQFETYGRFDPHAGVFGREVGGRLPRYRVFFEDDRWNVECGALHGLSAEPDQGAALSLYPEDAPEHLAGRATASFVGPQKSVVQPDFEADAGTAYRAEIASLGAAPVPVWVDGDDEAARPLHEALARLQGTDAPESAPPPACPICEAGTDGDDALAASWHPIDAELTARPAGTRYVIRAEGHRYVLEDHESGRTLQIADGSTQGSAMRILSVLGHVLQWERALALDNPHTRTPASAVELCFFESLPEGELHRHAGNAITLDYVKSGDQWPDLRGEIKVRNRTAEELHMALIYFSDRYGVFTLKNDPVAPTDDAWVTLWGTGPDDYFYLAPGEEQSIENFKLIVTRERIDDFLLTQKDLELGKVLRTTRGLGSVRPRNKPDAEDWCTRSLRIEVVRQQDRLGKGADVVAGNVRIRKHSTVTANVSLASSRSGSRSAGDLSVVPRALERLVSPESGGPVFEPVVLSSTRSAGAAPTVLELTDIQKPEDLAAEPLQIDLDFKDVDAQILPLTFDGTHVLLAGDVYQDEDGTHVSIDHLPEIPDNRRSLNKALKLYFFKTYLGRKGVNELRWVDYTDDGGVERRSDGVAEKVAAARNVILLVHGIIGDTEGMARGLRLARGGNGASLDRNFDLVLTYDYENLNTPIAETARDLKRQLEAVGLRAGDDKRLTLLVHSMGGLVSRWFVEREGGAALVDHLVMCGTPNHGSPYGKVDDVRRVLAALTAVALNFLPVAAPVGSAILFAINRSKKLIGTLSQMDAGSEFMEQLNAADRSDPGIPYTILAGDVGRYQAESDAPFAKLLEKAGKGVVLDTVFAHQPHDIAVSVESIRTVPGARQSEIACHHLNYFASPAGLEALAGVRW